VFIYTHLPLYTSNTQIQKKDVPIAMALSSIFNSNGLIGPIRRIKSNDKIGVIDQLQGMGFHDFKFHA